MGLEASCPITCTVMDAWVDEVKSLEEKSKILAKVNSIMYEPLEIHLLEKYVDDILSGLEQFKLGVRYNRVNKIFEWSTENEAKDR